MATPDTEFQSSTEDDDALEGGAAGSSEPRSFGPDLFEDDDEEDVLEAADDLDDDLDDDDLEDDEDLDDEDPLFMADEDADSAEGRGSGACADDVEDESHPRQERLLDEGIEETFPASDPVSVKHIT